MPKKKLSKLIIIITLLFSFSSISLRAESALWTKTKNFLSAIFAFVTWSENQEDPGDDQGQPQNNDAITPPSTTNIPPSNTPIENVTNNHNPEDNQRGFLGRIWQKIKRWFVSDTENNRENETNESHENSDEIDNLRAQVNNVEQEKIDLEQAFAAERLQIQEKTGQLGELIAGLIESKNVLEEKINRLLEQVIHLSEKCAQITETKSKQKQPLHNTVKELIEKNETIETNITQTLDELDKITQEKKEKEIEQLIHTRRKTGQEEADKNKTEELQKDIANLQQQSNDKLQKVANNISQKNAIVKALENQVDDISHDAPTDFSNTLGSNTTPAEKTSLDIPPKDIKQDDRIENVVPTTLDNPASKEKEKVDPLKQDNSVTIDQKVDIQADKPQEENQKHAEPLVLDNGNGKQYLPDNELQEKNDTSVTLDQKSNVQADKQQEDVLEVQNPDDNTQDNQDIQQEDVLEVPDQVKEEKSELQQVQVTKKRAAKKHKKKKKKKKKQPNFVAMGRKGYPAIEKKKIKTRVALRAKKKRRNSKKRVAHNDRHNYLYYTNTSFTLGKLDKLKKELAAKKRIIDTHKFEIDNAKKRIKKIDKYEEKRKAKELRLSKLSFEKAQTIRNQEIEDLQSQILMYNKDMTFKPNLDKSKKTFKK